MLIKTEFKYHLCYESKLDRFFDVLRVPLWTVLCSVEITEKLECSSKINLNSVAPLLVA